MSCCNSKTSKTTSCCGGQAKPSTDLRESVREGYTLIAEKGSLTAATKGGCCGTALECGRSGRQAGVLGG